MSFFIQFSWKSHHEYNGVFASLLSLIERPFDDPRINVMGMLCVYHRNLEDLTRKEWNSIHRYEVATDKNISSLKHFPVIKSVSPTFRALAVTLQFSDENVRHLNVYRKWDFNCSNHWIPNNKSQNCRLEISVLISEKESYFVSNT